MSIHEVTDPDTGEELSHYAWVSWMWCENETTVAGDYDEVKSAGECPECGEEPAVWAEVEDGMACEECGYLDEREQ